MYFLFIMIFKISKDWKRLNFIICFNNPDDALPLKRGVVIFSLLFKNRFSQDVNPFFQIVLTFIVKSKNWDIMFKWVKIVEHNWRMLIWIYSQVNFSCRCNFCLFNSWWIHRRSSHKRFIHIFESCDWSFWRVKGICIMLCWNAETHRNYQRRHRLTKHSEPEPTYGKTTDKLSNLKLCVFDWRPRSFDLDCSVFRFLLLSLPLLLQIQTKRNSLPNHARRQKNCFKCLKLIKIK